MSFEGYKIGKMDSGFEMFKDSRDDTIQRMEITFKYRPSRTDARTYKGWTKSGKQISIREKAVPTADGLNIVNSLCCMVNCCFAFNGKSGLQFSTVFDISARQRLYRLSDKSGPS